MSLYMVQLGWTPEAVAAFVKTPQDRTGVAVQVAEKLGGKLVSAYAALDGEYQAVIVVELPDNVSAAAFGTALYAGGLLKDMMATPLLTVEQAVEAQRKAGQASYRPPS